MCYLISLPWDVVEKPVAFNESNPNYLLYCTSQFQVENNNQNDMPSIIFSGGKKTSGKIIDCEMIHVRRRSNSSIDHEKKTVVSRNSRLVFPPDSAIISFTFAIV